MIRRLTWCVLLSLVLTGSAFAGFVNGGFETGDFSGWTQGAGFWFGGMNNLDPANYLPGGQFYDMSANASAVVGPGLDPNWILTPTITSTWSIMAAMPPASTTLTTITAFR